MSTTLVQLYVKAQGWRTRRKVRIWWNMLCWWLWLRWCVLPASAMWLPRWIRCSRT